MNEPSFSAVYRDYIACLNRQDWVELGRFVRDDVRHNGRSFGLTGYRVMLEGDFDAISIFISRSRSSSPKRLMWRAVRFDRTPKAMLFGLPVNGKRISFCENVIYEFLSEKSPRSGRSSTRLRSRLSCRRHGLCPASFQSRRRRASGLRYARPEWNDKPALAV